MALDVRAMLAAKDEKRKNKHVVMKDINRDLMIALLAIPVYGKEARDEEILSVIINAGGSVDTDQLEVFRTNYNQMVKDKKIKKTKSGVCDTDGFMVLVPR